MKEYEVFVDTDNGFLGLLIEAENKNKLYAELRKMLPNDIGADAWGIEPDTLDEFPIKW